LHRNTLVYRLERFEKLTGLDIRKFDDAMTFRIAMMVLANYNRNEDVTCE
jgi:carbohydrate diacid regulator